jgi:outer membrane protein assembly factor BamB
VKELWHSSRIRIHKDNVIWIDGIIYGSSGDFGPAFLTAVDGRTGRILWQDRTFAKASLIHADGKLIVLDEDGQLAVTVPSATGLQVLAKASVMQNNAWTVPTLVGAKVFVRDRRNAAAFELGAPAGRSR